MRWAQRLFMFGTSLLWAALPTAATAENEGLADLDEATEIKLEATSLADLGRTVDLLQSALNKGLDEQNSAFAQKMLLETLLERAELLTDALFDGKVLGGRGQQIRMWNMALSDVKRVVKIDEKHAGANLLLGRLEALAGNRDEAISALGKVADNTEAEQELRAKALILRGGLRTEHEARLADLSQAVQLAPESADALRARAVVYYGNRQWDEAIADVDRALKIDPRNVPTHELRGRAFASKQDHDAALECFSKAIELAPDSASAYAQRADIYLRKGNHQSALADLDKSLELAPRAIPVLLLRAGAKLQSGDAEKALEDIDQALQVQPGFLPAIKLRAEVLALSNQLDDAIATLEAAIEARQDDSELLMQLGSYCLADRQVSRAINLFERALAADQDNWRLHELRADAFLRVGKQAEAIADYETALKLQPERSSILNNLAWVLATSPDDKLRDGKRALELATKACQITDYKQAHILSTLAAAYAEAGQFNTAIDWSQKAVELGKDSPDSPHLAQELESYRHDQPWRERQTFDEESDRDKPADEPSSEPDPSQDKPDENAPKDSAPDDSDADDSDADDSDADDSDADDSDADDGDPQNGGT